MRNGTSLSIATLVIALNSASLLGSVGSDPSQLLASSNSVHQSERYAKVAQSRNVDATMSISVNAKKEHISVSMKISNRDGVDYVFIPTLLTLRVKPWLNTWYPADVRFCVMELVADTAPPAGNYLQHATSLVSLTNHPVQMVLLPRKRTTQIEYQLPYSEFAKREEIVGLSLYRGVFNVPLWARYDSARRDVIRRCLLPRSPNNRYLARVRDGVAIVAGNDVKTGFLSKDDIARLNNSESRFESLILTDVTIDPIVYR